MKQNQLTYEKFCQAVEELKKAGKNFLSTRAIREKIGGSNSTIMRMKERYLAEHPLPDGPIFSISPKLLKELEQEIKIKATEITQACADLRRLQAEASSEDAEICQELEQQVVALKGELAELKSRFVAIQEDLTAARIQASEQLNARESRIAELLMEKDDLDKSRDAAILAAQKHELSGQHSEANLRKSEELLSRKEQEIKELRQQLNEAREQAAETRAEARELRNRLDATSAEFSECKNYLAAERRESASLLSKLEVLQAANEKLKHESKSHHPQTPVRKN